MYQGFFAPNGDTDVDEYIARHVEPLAERGFTAVHIKVQGYGKRLFYQWRQQPPMTVCLFGSDPTAPASLTIETGRGQMIAAKINGQPELVGTAENPIRYDVPPNVPALELVCDKPTDMAAGFYTQTFRIHADGAVLPMLFDDPEAALAPPAE